MAQVYTNCRRYLDRFLNNFDFDFFYTPRFLWSVSLSLSVCLTGFALMYWGVFGLFMKSSAIAYLSTTKGFLDSSFLVASSGSVAVLACLKYVSEYRRRIGGLLIRGLYNRARRLRNRIAVYRLNKHFGWLLPAGAVELVVQQVSLAVRPSGYFYKYVTQNISVDNVAAAVIVHSLEAYYGSHKHSPFITTTLAYIKLRYKPINGARMRALAARTVLDVVEYHTQTDASDFQLLLNYFIRGFKEDLDFNYLIDNAPPSESLVLGIKPKSFMADPVLWAAVIAHAYVYSEEVLIIKCGTLRGCMCKPCQTARTYLTALGVQLIAEYKVVNCERNMRKIETPYGTYDCVYTRGGLTPKGANTLESLELCVTEMNSTYINSHLQLHSASVKDLLQCFTRQDLLKMQHATEEAVARYGYGGKFFQEVLVDVEKQSHLFDPGCVHPCGEFVLLDNSGHEWNKGYCCVDRDVVIFNTDCITTSAVIKNYDSLMLAVSTFIAKHGQCVLRVSYIADKGGDRTLDVPVEWFLRVPQDCFVFVPINRGDSMSIVKVGVKTPGRNRKQISAYDTDYVCGAMVRPKSVEVTKYTYDAGIVYTTLQTTKPGDCGSPMLAGDGRRTRVVAIHAGYSEKEGKTVAVPLTEEFILADTTMLMESKLEKGKMNLAQTVEAREAELFIKANVDKIVTPPTKVQIVAAIEPKQNPIEKQGAVTGNTEYLTALQHAEICRELDREFKAKALAFKEQLIKVEDISPDIEHLVKMEIPEEKQLRDQSCEQAFYYPGSADTQLATMSRILEVPITEVNTEAEFRSYFEQHEAIMRRVGVGKPPVGMQGGVSFSPDSFTLIPDNKEGRFWRTMLIKRRTQGSMGPYSKKCRGKFFDELLSLAPEQYDEEHKKFVAKVTAVYAGFMAKKRTFDRPTVVVFSKEQPIPLEKLRAGKHRNIALIDNAVQLAFAGYCAFGFQDVINNVFVLTFDNYLEQYNKECVKHQRPPLSLLGVDPKEFLADAPQAKDAYDVKLWEYSVRPENMGAFFAALRLSRVNYSIHWKRDLPWFMRLAQNFMSSHYVIRGEGVFVLPAQKYWLPSGYDFTLSGNTCMNLALILRSGVHIDDCTVHGDDSLFYAECPEMGQKLKNLGVDAVRDPRLMFCGINFSTDPPHIDLEAIHAKIRACEKSTESSALREVDKVAFTNDSKGFVKQSGELNNPKPAKTSAYRSYYDRFRRAVVDRAQVFARNVDDYFNSVEDYLDDQELPTVDSLHRSLLEKLRKAEMKRKRDSRPVMARQESFVCEEEEAAPVKIMSDQATQCRDGLVDVPMTKPADIANWCTSSDEGDVGVVNAQGLPSVDYVAYPKLLEGRSDADSDVSSFTLEPAPIEELSEDHREDPLLQSSSITKQGSVGLVVKQTRWREERDYDADRNFQEQEARRFFRNVSESHNGKRKKQQQESDSDDSDVSDVTDENDLAGSDYDSDGNPLTPEEIYRKRFMRETYGDVPSNYYEEYGRTEAAQQYISDLTNAGHTKYKGTSPADLSMSLKKILSLGKKASQLADKKNRKRALKGKKTKTSGKSWFQRRKGGL